VRELVFGSLEMFEQKREARCYAHGSLIPYPFQRHFRALSVPAVVEECERGLSSTDGGGRATDLDAYLRGRFGPGIAEHFLLPYNRKLWGADLTRLSTEWTGQRIAASSAAAAPAPSGAGERTPLQDDTIVAYPARGAFGEIFLALARRVPHLRLSTAVSVVDPARRQVVTASGEVFRWRRLISTFPIDRLLGLVREAPAELQAAAARLERISLSLVLAVIDGAVDTDVQRIYAADEAMVAHKVVVNHTSSPFLRSLPRHGIMGEVAEQAVGARPSEELERRFVDNLIELGLIPSGDRVVATTVIALPYAYPVPTRERAAIVARIAAWLRERGIHSVGRFGEWAYINSDEALFRGLTLGRALRAGA
jgi:UDP-galactopyranose mutase